MKNEVWKPSWSDLWTKVGSRAPGPREALGFWSHFGCQNQLKITIFRHRFLDAFLVGIFDGFGRFWGSFWRLLGGQMEPKTEKAEI